MRHLQSFRYVKAIATTGSIRGAAESLTISASALNRHVQSLEAELEIQIFERLSKGVRLTSEGELFLRFALNQLSGYESVRQQISSLKGLRSGKLTIGISTDFDQDVLQVMLARFQREHPNVNVQIFTLHSQADLYESIENHRIELALFVNPVMRKGLTILHGVDIELSAFVPLGLGLPRAAELRIYELQGIRLALPPASSEVTRRIESAIEKNKIETLVHYRGTNITRYLEHAFSAVIGITAMVDVGRSPTQVSGYKRVPLLRREIGTSTFCLVSSEGRGLSFAAHQFQEIFSEAFQ